MTIDIAYLFYTTALVVTGTLIVVFIEFLKFKRWAKWMDQQPEATPYREPEPVQLSKRQQRLFNQVYRNAKRECDARFKQVNK